jgi:molybdate-binding protein
VACCDPVAGLLASLYRQETGFRLIVIPRSTGAALDLLSRGLVQMAGLHLSTPGDEQRNAQAVRDQLGKGYKLLRMANWQDGVALASQSSARSVRSAAAARLRWVGREAGSGARQCMDELLPKKVSARRIAYDHWGVAEAIRCGWADAGVCLRLTCEEAKLKFLHLRDEFFDLCYTADAEQDPRVQALLRLVRSAGYRRQISELPGYDASATGEEQAV